MDSLEGVTEEQMVAYLQKNLQVDIASLKHKLKYWGLDEDECALHKAWLEHLESLLKSEDR